MGGGKVGVVHSMGMIFYVCSLVCITVYAFFCRGKSCSPAAEGFPRTFGGGANKGTVATLRRFVWLPAEHRGGARGMGRR